MQDKKTKDKRQKIKGKRQKARPDQQTKVLR
jgi:hypothetical protein